MVTGYEALLFVHVLAAVVWVGGGAATQFYAIRAMRSSDPGRLAGFAKDAEWVGMRVFMPASIVVLGAGFGLVAKGDWSLGTFWVAFGLGAVAVSALTGALFLGPEAGRIGKLIDASGADDPRVQARIRRIFVVSRIELAILVATVIDMVIKPA